MVTKLIRGILGRKEAAKVSQDVPDELPPLAEEIAAKVEQKQESSQDTPDELPPLDTSAVTPRAYPLENGTLEDLEKPGIPDAIKKAKMAKMGNAPELPTLQSTAPKEEIPAELPKIDISSMARESSFSASAMSSMSTNERISAGNEVGFFSNLLDHVRKHGGVKERLLSGDLLSRMSNYWDLRKHEIKTGSQLPAEKKLEEDLMKKLEELKVLEQKWQVQKLALEEDMKFIHEREREIQAKSKELKFITNELSLYKTVRPEEYFYLRNGVVLKSLHDLIGVLEVIDDVTLNYHINRNDFGSWIKNIFKDHELADKVKAAKTKLEIIEIIEASPPADDLFDKSHSHMITNPKKYFWLENGTVVRNLFELSDVLRVMDDLMFKKHVSEHKNDFAKWVSDVFKNEHLAEKMRRAKTKKDMIDVVEVFL